MHAIRLRGGWTLANPAASIDPTLPPNPRLNLPIHWPSSLPRLVRLERRFNSPPVNPTLERVALRLEAVPGLLSANLNGQPLPDVNPANHAIVVHVNLTPRSTNLLTLEVNLDIARQLLQNDPWGCVALEIQPISPP